MTGDPTPESHPEPTANTTPRPATTTEETTVTPTETPVTPTETPASTGRGTRLPTRVGPIVWGVFFFAFAVYVGTVIATGTIADPVAWLTAALILGGIALVIVGIVAAFRRR